MGHQCCSQPVALTSSAEGSSPLKHLISLVASLHFSRRRYPAQRDASFVVQASCCADGAGLEPTDPIGIHLLLHKQTELCSAHAPSHTLADVNSARVPTVRDRLEGRLRDGRKLLSPSVEQSLDVHALLELVLCSLGVTLRSWFARVMDDPPLPILLGRDHRRQARFSRWCVTAAPSSLAGQLRRVSLSPPGLPLRVGHGAVPRGWSTPRHFVTHPL